MNIGTPGAAYGPGFAKPNLPARFLDPGNRPVPGLPAAAQRLFGRARSMDPGFAGAGRSDVGGQFRRMPAPAPKQAAQAMQASIHGVMMGEMQRRVAAARAAQMSAVAQKAHLNFQNSVNGGQDEVGLAPAAEQAAPQSMGQMDPAMLQALLAHARLTGFQGLPQ